LILREDKPGDAVAVILNNLEGIKLVPRFTLALTPTASIGNQGHKTSSSELFSKIGETHLFYNCKPVDHDYPSAVSASVLLSGT